MADLADVEAALVGLATTALYPDGQTATSAVGVDCRIYRGWPTPAALDADLRTGKVNVTVFPDSAPGQTLTRYTSEWFGTPTIPALSVSVAGNTVNFSGTADVGQVAGILFANRTFVYRTVAGDTPRTVAANLAVFIRARQVVQLSGATLTIPGASNVVARVVADSSVAQEVRRQSHDVRITCWCPTPSLRDSAVAAIDSALASRVFIALPDSSQAHIAYKNTTVFDQSQNASLYRRDLIYTVEYPTILSVSAPAMLFGDLALNAINVSV